jgi:hypothetical protein
MSETTGTDLTLVPAYVLRSYAWAVLQANDPETWDESKYGDLLPIVPVSEEPDIEQYAGPHIVYGYVESSTGDLVAQTTGSVTFVVYDQKFRRLTKTINILKEAFGRKDDTATDVNRFSGAYDPSNSETYPYLGITFGTIYIAFIEGGAPEETEGGRQSAIVTVMYTSQTEYKIKTRV